MSDLNTLFRHRIGISDDLELTFKNLHTVLEKTAWTIPFENLCIMEKKLADITKENLIDKVILRNEGGLCYELNTIFYLFLLENEFDVSLVRGIVFNQNTNEWNNNGRTHVTIICSYEDELYLIDTGFGGNLPLKPIPLNGKVVTSNNGAFKVERVEHALGDYILYMKLKDKDEDWKIGYIFDSREVVKDLSTLNEVQEIILSHPESAFNKGKLITKLTERGSVTLTESSITKWVDGEVEKAEINQKQFNEMLKEYFGIAVYSQ